MSIHSKKVDEKIRAFEKAIITKEIELNPLNIKKIFLAIDSHENASEINKNAIQIALNIAIRFQAEVYIACISLTLEELKISEKLVNDNITLFESKKIPVTGSCSLGRPSEHILKLSQEFNPNIIIITIPYGERAESFDIESLGSTIDLVIRKSPFPILLVRKPVFNAKDIGKNVLLVINKKENIKAAEFALTLVEKGSKIKILSITEKKIAEKVENIIQTISKTDLENHTIEQVHKEEIQILVYKISEKSISQGIKVERIHLLGNWVKLTLEQAKQNQTIIVLSTDLLENNILISEVENVVKLSKIPTLIVKN